MAVTYRSRVLVDKMLLIRETDADWHVAGLGVDEAVTLHAQLGIAIRSACNTALDAVVQSEVSVAIAPVG